MKIEYIAPVESMRGNLSGKQNLEYPPSNNPAWDTPDDGIKYARNYQPRYIGARRTATGRNYFSVKKRSGVNITTAQRRVQATLGVAKIYADSVWASAVPLELANRIWRDHVAAGYKYTTLTGFLTAMLRDGILMGDRVISVGEQGVSTYRLSVTNVFNTIATAVGDVTPVVNRALVAKFFPYIGVSSSPLEFGYLGNKVNPFAFGMSASWSDLISDDTAWIVEYNSGYSFASTAIGGTDYVTCNFGGTTMYIMRNGDYVTADDTIVQGSVYNLTAVAPA